MAESLIKKQAKSLIDCLNECNLVDLRFKGYKYTWSNHRKRKNSLIMERLDRVYFSDEWLQAFPNVTITHLPKIQSDHNPILINLNNRINTSYDRPFRIETFWCSHPNFPRIVSQSWKNKDLVGGAEFLKNNALEWKKNTFDNIFTKKRKILQRIDAIQNSPSYTTRHYLRNLESTLIEDYNTILKQERLLEIKI